MDKEILTVGILKELLHELNDDNVVVLYNADSQTYDTVSNMYIAEYNGEELEISEHVLIKGD